MPFLAVLGAPRADEGATREEEEGKKKEHPRLNDSAERPELDARGP